MVKVVLLKEPLITIRGCTMITDFDDFATWMYVLIMISSGRSGNCTNIPALKMRADAHERDAADDLFETDRDLTILAQNWPQSWPNVMAFVLWGCQGQTRSNRFHPEYINSLSNFKLKPLTPTAFGALCNRLYIKLAAYTLCIYLNLLLGNPESSITHPQ